MSTLSVSLGLLSYLGKAHQKLGIVGNDVCRILLLALLAGDRRRRGGRRGRTGRVQARAGALGEGREGVSSRPSQGGHGPQGEGPEGDGVGGHRMEWRRDDDRREPKKGQKK